MGRILVVDDEKIVREILLKMIEHLGHKVISAADGKEGLYSFVNDTIDLEVTDYDMPFMNGWSLAQNVKQRSPGTPVVLVTGSDNYINGQEVKDNIYDCVLLRPFGFQEIKETIRIFMPDRIVTAAVGGRQVYEGRNET